MRKTLLAGLVLTAAAVLVVVVSAMFDLELESVALLGAALGFLTRAVVLDRARRTDRNLVGQGVVHRLLS